MKVITPQAELREVRHAIDGVDQAIATLLAARLRLSRLAITTKAREGLPVLDPIRELEIHGYYDRYALGASAVAKSMLCWCRGYHER